MANKDREIEIYPRRKPVDPEQLAKALLSLVDRLSADEKAYFVAQGEKVLTELKAKPRGTAA